MRNNTLAALLIATASLLAGCGGGSSNDVPYPAAPPAPPAQASGLIPASATGSIQAFVDFLAALMPSETATPLNIDAAVPPTSETAAPLPVN